MIKPKALKQKDVIGIVAPADSFSKTSFWEGVKKIKSWGFKVKFNSEIFEHKGYFAGSDEARAKQLNKMFKDSKVKAIFCAKAGYGTSRIIPFLNDKAIRKHPKIVLGYSDITILLSYLNCVHDMVVFHGPVVSDEICPDMPYIVEKQLLSLLTGKGGSVLLKNNFKIIRKGRAEGILAGGNFSRVVNTLGTGFEIDTQDKILLLEDIDVSLEDVDGMLNQLKLAGKLEGLKGMIFGQVIDPCGRRIGKNFLVKLIDSLVKDKDIPIVCTDNIGHGRINLPVPLGVKVVLDTKKRILFLKEKPVRG